MKVATTYRADEAATWRETLQAEQIEPSIREVPRQPGPPPTASCWEVWVRVKDEPHARLILGFSGHSVIRLPRRRSEQKKE